MNKNTLNQLLSHPRKMNEQEMQSLGELCNEYPYSYPIRKLYLKALLDNEQHNFERELEKTSTFSFDRIALKKFLFAKDQVLTAVKKKSPIEKKEEPFSPATAEGTVPNTEQHKATLEDNELSADLLSEAINASITLEVTPDEAPSEEFEERALKQKLEPKLPSPAASEKKSFIDWIKSYDEEQRQKASERKEFRKSAEALIDSFIHNQPKITAKKEFYSPINMAEKSVSESDDLISETLAKVYAGQGKIQKAIETYEKLSLKFPEKKAYFASAIEKLKE